MFECATMGAQMLHFDRAANPWVVQSLSSRSCFCTLSLNASSRSWAISSNFGPVWRSVGNCMTLRHERPSFLQKWRYTPKLHPGNAQAVASKQNSELPTKRESLYWELRGKYQRRPHQLELGYMAGYEPVRYLAFVGHNLKAKTPGGSRPVPSSCCQFKIDPRNPCTRPNAAAAAAAKRSSGRWLLKSIIFRTRDSLLYAKRKAPA